MAEDQAQFGETPPVRRGLIVDLISGLFEKLQSLSAFLHEVIHKDAKELILAQGGHVALVNGEYQLQVLWGHRRERVGTSMAYTAAPNLHSTSV